MDQYILAKLKKLYPDKRVSNMYKDYPLEYSYLRIEASKKRMSISEYLESNGFEYIVYRTGTFGKRFDSRTAKLLIDEYGFSGTDFAKLLNVTRAEISRKIINNVNNINWKSGFLRYSEIEQVKYMVLHDLFELEQGELFIKIGNNGKDACVFVKNSSLIKVVFDLPERLDTYLKNHHYHILNHVDMDIKKNLKPVKVMGQNLAVYSYPGLSSRISNRCIRLGVTRDEYLKLLGHNGLCRNGKETDEDIIKILRKYSDSNNRVYFPNRGPHKPPEYNSIANRASREQMSIEDFFKFFGFTKERARHKTTYYKKADEFKKELSKIRIDNTNKVYIKSDTNFYRRLYAFSRLRNMTLDAMIAELGFERVLDSTK